MLIDTTRTLRPSSLLTLAALIAALVALPAGAQVWTPPVEVMPFGGLQSAWVRDSTGALHAVTQALPGLGEAQLYHSYRPAGGAWTSSTLVSHSLQVATLPDMAGYRALFEDDAGVVHLFYETPPDELGTQQVWHRRLSTASPEAGWSAPTDVSRSPDAIATLLAAVVDSEGTVHVLFSAAPGLGTLQIFHAYRESGGPWSTPQQVSHSTQGAFFYSRFDVFATLPGYRTLLEDGTGVLHLLYETKPDVLGVRQIWHRRLDSEAPDAGWTAPVNISQASQPAATLATMIDSTGALHVLFEAIPGFGTSQLFHTRRPAQGAWTVPVQVSHAAEFAPRFPLEFEYRFFQEDGSGQLHVFYETIPGLGVLQIWHRRFDTSSPGDGWTTPVDVSQSPQPAFAQALAIDDHDTLHLIFRSLPGAPATQQLFYASHAPGAGWTTPVQVSHSTQGAHVSGFFDDFPDLPAAPGYAFFRADADGTLHLLYETSPTAFDPPQIWHRKLSAEDDGWSMPTNVSASSQPSDALGLVIDADRTLHLVFLGELGLTRSQRPVGGSWSVPQQIQAGGWLPSVISHPFFADDGAGRLHLFTTAQSSLWHSSRAVPVPPAPPVPLIFADGFESGNVSAWSSAMP